MEKLTILRMRELTEEKLEIGDVVEFKKEPSNKEDSNAIMVLYQDKQIGYVANNPNKTVIEGTISATEIGSQNPISAKITSIEEDRGFVTTYIAGDIQFEEVEAPSQLDFSLVGGITTFDGKATLLKDIQDKGEQNILLKVEDGYLMGYYDGRSAGRVRAEGSIERRLIDITEDSIEVRAVATSQTRGEIYCYLKMKSTQIVQPKEDLETIMEELIKEGTDSKKNLDEKLEYLVSNGVSKVNIADIFLTYTKYDDVNRARINKPKTLYIDSSGIVNDSVIYILESNNLIYEGDKGVGKNVLTETISWLFHRPLYEFSSNSQHSNNSLMGGETFKSPEENKEEEQVVSGVLKKVVNNFLGKFIKEDDDNKELDIIANFVKNTVGKDDKELVFQMSSILEAFVNGGIIVLDEFNTSQAHVMPLFNALLDERRRVEVTGLGKVEAHPNFVAIGTQNKGYQGTFDSNEATLDRFEPLIFPPLESISKLLEVKNPNIGYETIDICNKVYQGIKQGVESGTLGEDAISTRGFISASNAITRGMTIKRALVNSIANRAVDLDDRETIKNIIDLQVGNQ